MSVSIISTEDLRGMHEREGLVLQGCGGDLQEWIDGINGLLTDEGILRNQSKFENAFAFKNGNLTNLLFPFDEEMDINIGKLAVWRIGTHEQFGGTWLSDYVPNQLGGFTELPSPTEEMEMEP